ncbi:MAG: RNA-binding protein [bacterium]
MNIYIANLSFDVDDNDLRELFADYGEVSSAKVITDKVTSRSRGFGFVEMKNDEQGQKAITELNQATYDDKIISVNIARPKPARSQGTSFSTPRDRGGFNSGRRNYR